MPLISRTARATSTPFESFGVDRHLNARSCGSRRNAALEPAQENRPGPCEGT